MTPRHPLPEPTLFERTCYVVAIGAVMLAVAVLAGCGEKPTAPKANPCIVVDTIWSEGKAVLTLTHYYSPPCPPKKVAVTSPARSVRGGGYASDR